MWFDSNEARLAGFGTDVGRAAVAHAMADCASRTHLLTEEKILIA